MYDAGNDEKHKFPEDFSNYVKRENLLCWEYRRIYDVGTNFYVFQKAHAPDDGVSSDTSMGFSASTVQSKFQVTIKAKYGKDRFIRFQLSAYSGIDELYNQLSQRLGLVYGTYDLRYRDEDNDLIELICDEDLQLYISDSIEAKTSTLMGLIVPKYGEMEYGEMYVRVTPDCHRLVDSLISFFKRDAFLKWRFLVQFWAAEQVVNSVDEINYRLTTSNQPFLLRDYRSWNPEHEGLCRYRMKTCDVSVAGDGRGGAIGRVFRNKRVEYSPHVGYYSSEEYPHRDVALSCDIKNSLVVPWFDSYGKVVGVIEFVSPHNPYSFVEVVEFFDGYLSSSLGRGVDGYQGLCCQDLEKDFLSSALSEIKEVMGVVFESRIILFSRTWMLCNSCNSLSTCQYYPKHSASLGSYYGIHFFFKEVENTCILQNGEGVVGKAAKSSHNLVYCENVAKFSIIEYPLAHFACLCNLSACFALCLRSSYTGNQVYILEFFLSPEHVRGVDLRTMLVPILDLMKRNFRTFKVASGREELGDRLLVLVTDANSPDKLETLIGLETSMEDTPMEDAPVASASTVQSEFQVTIKAKYGEDRFIKFRLSTSLGIQELYHQLSRRLELVGGTYDLKYLDEKNDPIELTCDEDLQLFISDSVEHEISPLMVVIVPK